MPKRRKYSTESKQGAVRRARHPGASCAQITRELGVGANVLTRWKREADGVGVSSGTGNPKGVELAQLTRDFTALEPETQWVADITEIQTQEGRQAVCVRGHRLF